MCCCLWMETECQMGSDPGGIRSGWDQGAGGSTACPEGARCTLRSYEDLIPPESDPSLGTLLPSTRCRYTISLPQEPAEAVSAKRDQEIN